MARYDMHLFSKDQPDEASCIIALTPSPEIAEQEVQNTLADSAYAWVERYELWDGEDELDAGFMPLAGTQSSM